MAPAALESGLGFITNGQKHIVGQSAPSDVVNEHLGNLSELDASQMIFMKSKQPKAVPEPNSPEVWAQNV